MTAPRPTPVPARRDAAPRQSRHEPVPLGALLEQAADGVLLVDEGASIVLAANAAACAMLALARPAIVGERYAALLDPADVAARPPERHEGCGARAVVERRLRRADGAHAAAEVAASVLDDGRRLLVLRDLAAREAAQAALRESERDLRALFAAMRDVVVVLDRAGRYTRIVPTGRELLVRPPDELLGRLLHEVLPAAEATRFLAAIHRVLDTGAAEEVEYSLALGPRTTWFLATVSPLGADSVLWVARDVTAQRRAELALTESERRYRALVELSPDAIVVHVDGTIVYANAAAAALIGAAEPGELLGTSVLARVPRPDRAGVMQRQSMVPAGSVAPLAEERLLRLDGRVVHADVVAAPVEFDGAAAVLVLMRDASARREAEAAERRTTAILEATPDIVAIATPRGRVEYLNAAGRRLLGARDPGDVAALALDELQPELVHGLRAGAVRRAVLRDGVWHGETVLRRRDGREVPVEQTILAHRAPDGSLEYVSTVLRDVTERRQGEATLRALALVDELTQLYNRRGFLAIAEQQLRAAARAGRGAALFFVDLDGLKAINDTYGHEAGDAALRLAAQALRAAFRDDDVVARLGGDEFVALATCGPREAGDALPCAARAVVRIAARLDAAVAAANAPADAGERAWRLALGVGTAIGDPAARSLAELLTEADAALYERKRSRPR